MSTHFPKFALANSDQGTSRPSLTKQTPTFHEYHDQSSLEPYLQILTLKANMDKLCILLNGLDGRNITSINDAG